MSSQSVARKKEFSKLDELADEWGLTAAGIAERQNALSQEDWINSLSPKP